MSTTYYSWTKKYFRPKSRKKQLLSWQLRILRDDVDADYFFGVLETWNVDVTKLYVFLDWIEEPSSFFEVDFRLPTDLSEERGEDPTLMSINAVVADDGIIFAAGRYTNKWSTGIFIATRR